MCFVKYLTVAFSVGLPAKINNLVTASQAQFQQFRVIKHLYVRRQKQEQQRTLVMIWNFLLTMLSERQYRHCRFCANCLTFFHFSS